MSNQRLSKSHIPTLKRLAKSIKRDQGILHSEALDQVAQQYGYNAWSHLQSSIPERAVTESAENLLREFFDGRREKRHLKMVIVLWEHLGHTPLVNRLLSELRDADGAAIGEMYSGLKNESPQRLYDAIERAFFECMKIDHEASERQNALNEAAVDAYIEKHIDEYEEDQAREQMGMLLSRLPPHTQTTILRHQFQVAGRDGPISLHDASWFYREDQQRVDAVFLLINLVHECIRYSSDFDGPESLDNWLITPFDPAKKESLCPLDALGSDVALEYLDTFAAKIDEETADPRAEAAVKSWVDQWMAEPQRILPEHRHLLDDENTAKLHFETLRESALQVSVQQMGALAL